MAAAGSPTGVGFGRGFFKAPRTARMDGGSRQDFFGDVFPAYVRGLRSGDQDRGISVRALFGPGGAVARGVVHLLLAQFSRSHRGRRILRSLCGMRSVGACV